LAALTVEFTVMGIPCLSLNGGPVFKLNEAFSFQSQPLTRPKPIATVVDNGGQESVRGW
jgi:predicted 3-demethylubiquinone-9 3-methyltransferase (glyoxalase superfamily)